MLYVQSVYNSGVKFTAVSVKICRSTERKKKMKFKRLLNAILALTMIVEMNVSAYAIGSNQEYYESLNWSYMFDESNAYISCGFKGYSGHEGFDIATAGGTKIKNPSLGYVRNVFLDTNACGYGLTVETVYEDPDTGNDLINTFMHMQSQPNWSVGDMVYKTNILGYVGTTGNSSGNHLHMQVSKDGTWWGSGNINNFINPIYFFPDINFTGDTTIRNVNDQHSCIVIDQAYIDKYILDIAYVNYVGEENIVKWLDYTEKSQSEKDIQSFKEFFNIDESVEKQIDIIHKENAFKIEIAKKKLGMR